MSFQIQEYEEGTAWAFQYKASIHILSTEDISFGKETISLFFKGSLVDWTSELTYKWEAAMLHPMWSDGTVTSGR